jgi:N-acetylglucosaminyl-diphospho-decaprenol L-rhamnosyltransferase
MKAINLMPDISIVMVNFNTAKYTLQCIESVYSNPPKLSYEIIVVDNASSDDSVFLIEEKYPKIKLIRSAKNLGIAGGNNLGTRSGVGRYVLLLNNDTIVLPGMLDIVVNFLENTPDAGGVGGNLLNPDNTYQSGAMPFPSLLEEFLNLSKLGKIIRPCYPSYLPYSKIKVVDWMSTAFMLFRRDALEEVGLMDEQYFIYSDETDLEYRLWRAGWKIYYIPEVNTIHFGGKSLEPWRSRRLKYRGRLLFFNKHRTSFEEIILRIIYTISSCLKLLFWMCVFLIPSKRKHAKLELKSHFDILKLSISPDIKPAIV